jgi:hypothetical protein
LELCYQLSKSPFWSGRLQTTDKARMEDVAFISELVFVLLEKTELTATDEELDTYYAKYALADNIDWKQLGLQFELLTNFIIDLGLDYEYLRISGVSHLYGLWCFAFSCLEMKIKPQTVADNLIKFFELARQRDYSNPASNDYKQSMSNRTKFKGQRTKRKNALLAFCGL